VKKTKTQEQKNKNSRIFPKKLEILATFYSFNAQILFEELILGQF